MKHLLLFFCLNLSVSASSFAEISFINGDLKFAKERAAREGKLIFLDFWASYCTPCRMMEEYTFTDPSVSNYVRDNYIPVKVDIQSFDGYDLKNQYGVSLLPTIIVMNSKGIMVGRHEETFSATRFLSILQTYNKSHNKTKITPQSPDLYGNNTYNKATGYSNNSNKISSIHASATEPQKTASPSRATPKPVTVAYTPARQTTKDAVSTSENANFTIQVGAYSSKNELNVAITSVKQKFKGSQRMFVSERKENGKWVYRILVGHFATRQKAQSFLQTSGAKGFVRTVESLQ